MEYLMGKNNRRFETEASCLEDVIEDIRALYPKCNDIKFKTVSIKSYYYDIYVDNTYIGLLIDRNRCLLE